MILKIKSFIYRHTGVYLAAAEENEYLLSKEFWDSFNEILNRENEYPDKCDRLKPRDIQSILVGSWQCQHKFYRRFKHQRFPYKQLDKLKKLCKIK